MQIKYVGDDGQVLRCKTVGHITQSTFEQNEACFAATFGADVFSRKVLLSLQESDVIDSSGVGWIISSNKRFKEFGGKLVLHSVTPNVRQLLQMLKLDSVLTVADDADTARKFALGEAA